jgi:hypothetical protein
LAIVALCAIAVLTASTACHGEITPVPVPLDGGEDDAGDRGDAGSSIGYAPMRCLTPSKVPTDDPPAIANAPYQPSVSACWSSVPQSIKFASVIVPARTAALRARPAATERV